MRKLPPLGHPSLTRHNQRVCRIAQSRPGYKSRHVRFLPRIRDIDAWRALGGSKHALSLFARRHGPGPIEALKHALPFDMFPFADRIEATRLRAKGVIL